jgi:hypothetical protein
VVGRAREVRSDGEDGRGEGEERDSATTDDDATRQSTDNGATRSWREEAEAVEGDERGGSCVTHQSPDDVTGKMAGGEGEDRDDAPHAHP